MRWARRFGLRGVRKWLARLSSVFQSATGVAARNGDAATLRALIDAGVDVNKTNGSGSTPVYLAAQNGAADAVELLVAAGADLDAPRNTGATPCLIAAMHGPRPASIQLVRHRLESSLASTQATTRRSRP